MRFLYRQPVEMQHCDYFDYWGRGTEVTVQSDTVSAPSLYPVVNCASTPGDDITVGCLALDFYPNKLTMEWTDASGATVKSEQYPPVAKNNKYTQISVAQLRKSDWDSRKSLKCSVNHDGNNKELQVQKRLPAKVTLTSMPSEDTQALVCTIEDSINGTNVFFNWKKNNIKVDNFIQTNFQNIGQLYSAVSVLKVKNTDWESKAVFTCEVTHRGQTHKKKISKASITVTLNPPSAKTIFTNNQAEYECVVTGEDKDIVSESVITWQINGEDVNKETKVADHPYSKTSTLTVTEWQQVSNVRCSATREDMTPVIQDLTVHKGDGTEPTVTVHTLPQEDIDRNSDVTLVCLVSSSVQQDYYIAWSGDSGRQTGNYADGITSPPQKTKNGYLVTSVYSVAKTKWEQQNYVITCNVWPAGSNMSMTSRGVSNAMGNSIECDK
ncbi:hypothetical protein PAMA_009357 [Pampus argenteus]